MDKEKEICDMGAIILNSIYSQPIGERTLRTEIELAMALQKAGYGNVKQAVKEFAEELKEELPNFACGNSEEEVLCKIEVCMEVENRIDNLITELYGSCDNCPSNNNAEWDERNCPNKGECGKRLRR